MIFLDHISDILKRWSAERFTITELSKLSNRELQDIGMARCDIYRIARENTIQKMPMRAIELTSSLSGSPATQS